MKSVKILMVTRLFPSSVFPVMGTFCAERVKAMSRYADVRVLVPTPYWPKWLPIGPWKKMARVEPGLETEDGVLVRYPRYPMLPWVATWLQGLTMSLAVRKAFRRFPDNWRPDIIDGQFAFPDGYAAVRLAERLGCPSVVTCHGSDLKLYPSLVITRSMLQRTLQRTNRVISVSTWLRTRSIELGCAETDAVFLTNGVDTDKFIVRDRAVCRKRLSLPMEPPIAICVGHLNDNKNQTVLIRALAEMSSRGAKPPHLVLVGDGPNRRLLEREAEQLGVRELVRFAGNRPHDEIPYWMGAGDWLMLSSHYEGWATVYFEAMACGRPVITSNVPSAKDCVCDERYGMVVEPNTPDAFADAMTRAQDRIYDPVAIRAYAEENSWDRWAGKMMDIIAHVMRTSEK